MVAAQSQFVHWVKAAGRPNEARLSRCRALAGLVARQSEELESKTNDELRRMTAELRWRCKAGEDLSNFLTEAYALMHQACRRTLGLTFYPVQVMGALALFEGGIVEMQTGEGKTLTALMPAFLRALPGKGCH